MKIIDYLHYVSYDKTTGTVWGLADSYEKALNDARFWIKSHCGSSSILNNKLKTVRCSQRFYDTANMSFGGDFEELIHWRIVNNVAYLEEELVLTPNGDISADTRKQAKNS